MSVAEYLEYEGTAESRHEYYDGVIYDMAGGSPNHNRIAVDTAAALVPLLRDRGCEVFAFDMRLQVDVTKYSYPDIVVTCGQAQFTDETPPSLLDPVLVIEVLSNSTERFDREGKFDYYASRSSLREYVLIAQDQPRVERYFRTGLTSWEFEVYHGLDLAVHLRSLDLDVPMAAIYQRVEFEAESEESA
jgi:Uma2 family endonuclease